MKFLLLLACLAAVPCFARQTGSISGRVTNSQTGEGVAGATLHLNSIGPPQQTQGSPTGPSTTKSSPDGSFQFESVPTGLYLVSADASGYTAMHRNSTFSVDSGQAVSDVAIVLDPEGHLTGRVLDDEGNPVAGAGIEALSSYRFHGRTQLRRSAMGQTDQNGNFTLSGIIPGKYYLDASPQTQKQDSKSETPAKDPEKFDLVRTYFPQAPDIGGATMLDLAPGQNLADLTIRLTRAATYHVRGHVEGLQSTGKGKGAQISLALRDGSESSIAVRSVALAADSTFDIDNVQSGTYTIRLTGTSENADTSQPVSRMRANRVLASAEVQVGTADVGGIVLTPLPPVVLTGHVTVGNANGATFNVAQTRISLASIDAYAARGFSVGTVVNQDGSFTISGLDPGRYSVQALNPPRGTYVKAVLFNQQDLGTGVLDLSQGGSGTLDIVLRQGLAEVDGMVSADSSSSTKAYSTIILVPDNIPADGTGSIFSSAAPGRSFVIQTVPPGRYHAFAVAHWDPLLWQDADFLHAVANDGVTVEVEENGHAQIQLTLTTPDQVDQLVARYGINPQQ